MSTCSLLYRWLPEIDPARGLYRPQIPTGRGRYLRQRSLRLGVAGLLGRGVQLVRGDGLVEHVEVGPVPGGLALGGSRDHEVDGLRYRGAVRRLVRPQVHAYVTPRPGEPAERLRIEVDVVPGAGTGQFGGLRAVALDLLGDPVGAHALDQRLRGRGLPDVQLQHGILQILERPVVVRRLRLRLAQRTGAHPGQELRQPRHHAAVVGRTPAGGARIEDRQRVDHLRDRLRRLDDAFLAPDRGARYDLAERHVGVHLRGGVQEPGADVEFGPGRVLGVAGVEPGQRQVGDRLPGARSRRQATGRGR